MEIFELKIKDLDPSTISMARLASYMEELAKLMGEKESVIFEEVYSSSLGLRTRVRDSAAPTVRSRVSNPQIKQDSASAHTRIQAMLAEDSTSAEVIHQGATILQIAPKQKAAAIMSPLEMINIRGKLVAIGGKDESVPFTIVEQSSGVTMRGNTSVDVAKALAHQLFNIIEVSGTGYWIKDPDSDTWDLQKFKASSFLPLKSVPVAQTIQALRELSDAAARNPLEILKELRE